MLDSRNNARLIDFGLAREADDATTEAGGNKYYSRPDDGKCPEGATVCHDYYAFGVSK